MTAITGGRHRVGDKTFAEQDRRRLGELKSRVDLSGEEREEMDGLNRRFMEHVLGEISGDFILIEDSGGGQLIPYSEAAKQAVPNTIVPRDRDQLRVTLKDLEARGFTIQRKKAA